MTPRRNRAPNHAETPAVEALRVSILPVQPSHAVAYLAFGLFGGVIGGLLGVGGAIGIVPLAAIFLDPPKDLLQGAVMVSNAAVAITAYRRYLRAGTVDWSSARRIVPAALLTVGIGVALSLAVDSRGFRVLFALTLVGIGVREALQLVRGTGAGTEGAGPIGPARGAVVGAAMGAISGLLGIGGGVVGVPIMRAWTQMPIKRAVVTSVCTMVPLTLLGASIKGATLARDTMPDGTNALAGALMIAACLLPSAVAGSWLGASLNLRITGNAVRWVLVAWLPASAAWMAWPAVSGWLSQPR